MDCHIIYLYYSFCIHLIMKRTPLAFPFRGCFRVNIPPFTVNKCLGTVGCLVSHESWNIMIPARALFNYLLSFCPIDLHCEPFNYTIHHLLNMKNGVKRMLIKPCRKVFCEGPVNQANGLCGLRIYVCTYVVSPLFFSASCHQFYLILSSKPMEARCLWRQVPWIHFNAFACNSLCVFGFCSGS